jgi:hypothetical protein
MRLRDHFRFRTAFIDWLIVIGVALAVWGLARTIEVRQCIQADALYDRNQPPGGYR